jgi:cytochrome c-type biogenesis protein CcmH/NrfG
VLLDRKRVKFWQKWVFLFMAILMASFLIFGYSGVLQGCSNRVGLTQANPAEARVKDLTKQLQADPTNGQKMLALAEAYQIRGGTQQTGSSQAQSDYAQALALYEKFLGLTPAQQGATKQEIKDNRVKALESQGQIYVSQQDWAKVVKVYQSLTGLRPKNADYFLLLGEAASQNGDTPTALLAFTRFLQLAPNDPNATTVKDWIKSQTQSASPTPSPTSSP